MERFHVYEVVGRVFFRESNNRPVPPIECVVIRTRAEVGKATDDGGADIMVSVLVTGYYDFHLDTWFSGWTELDNITVDDYQSGRPVDVAVPIEAYHRLIDDGRATEWQQDIAAVRVNDRWLIPSMSWYRLGKTTSHET